MATTVPPTQWSKSLRAIHLLLAIAVTAQLLVGSLMHSPEPGEPDSLGFLSHEVIGTLALVLLVIHWFWSVTHPDEGIRHQFPWTRTGMQRVASDLRGIVGRFRLPHGGPQDQGLVGFVHGLGMLATTAAATVGGTFVLARQAGMDRGTLEIIKDFHGFLAAMVWVYWGGHLAAAGLHSVLGQPVWRRMFRFKH